jgi:FAD synthase
MASLTASAAKDIKPQAYFYLGKFQPFHNGHLNVLTQMVDQAKKDDAKVFLFSTRKHNSVTHPISPDNKHKMLQQMIKEKFPDIEIEFKMVNGLYDATNELAKKNITHATIMAGDDRLIEYRKQGKRGMNNVFFTVSPIDRTKDKISGTAIRNKILKKQNIDSDVNKVYDYKTISELTDIIEKANLQQSRQTRKTSASKSKKNSGGKTYRRRHRTHRRPRRRGTHRRSRRRRPIL